MRVLFRLLFAAGVSGCSVLTPMAQIQPIGKQTAEVTKISVDFTTVVRRVEPLAEQMCRQQAPKANCDFRIFVDDRVGQPPNAYQRVDNRGRPEIGFTTALIASAHNDDELAFVLGHEAAHHISGHLGKLQSSAFAGAALGGFLATMVGGSAAAIDRAQNLGGNVGARTYTKGFELDADRLGTVIAFRAGYDPVKGAAFFARIPDPGNRFLGTHPQNAARIKVVRQTMAGLS